MPYRHAHFIILALLVPAIGVAFWRDYFGVLPSAPFAFHAHGVTASLWILLVAAQSWTVHARKFAWHRAAARATLVVVPLFAAAAMLVVHSMAIKWLLKSNPFYAMLGGRLALDDLLTTAILVAMVRAAIRKRRRVGLHAAYMLSTVLLVLPPVIARLPIPAGFYISFAISVGVALALYAIRRRDGAPFLIAAAYGVGRLVLLDTLGASDGWAAVVARLAGLPVAPLALAALLAAGAAIWTVWPWKRAPVAPPLPAA